MSEHPHGSSRGFRCVAANDNLAPASPACRHGSDTGADAAAVIGLALAHARKAGTNSAPVPASVMAHLDDLADRGDPACRMVRNWIRSKADRGKAEIISAAASGEVR